MNNPPTTPRLLTYVLVLSLFLARAAGALLQAQRGPQHYHRCHRAPLPLGPEGLEAEDGVCQVVLLLIARRGEPLSWKQRGGEVGFEDVRTDRKRRKQQRVD